MTFGTDDKAHRDRLRSLLSDGKRHTQAEMRAAGGDRYGGRLFELRHEENLDVACFRVDQGVYEYQLKGERTPEGRRSWKQRALAAEARVAELEGQAQ